MVGAEGHRVGVTGVIGAVVATRDHPILLEEVPRAANLTAVATHAEAAEEIAAACGVSSTQKLCEFTISGDTEAVVERFSGAMGPARAAVGLVSHVTDHVLAFRPVFSGIKGGRELSAQEFRGFGFFGRVEGPERIHHSAHKALGLLNGQALELGGDFGGPGGLSGVDSGHEFFVVEFGVLDG